MSAAHPFVAQVVLDCTHPRPLAEFYRELLGYAYRPGDEAPAAGDPDPNGADWLVLRPEPGARSAGRGLAFQASADYRPPVWANPDGQQQMLHLDLTVPDTESLEHQRERVIALGGSQLLDRSADDEEPLYVFADPAGHPFCIFVA